MKEEHLNKYPVSLNTPPSMLKMLSDIEIAHDMHEASKYADYKDEIKFWEDEYNNYMKNGSSYYTTDMPVNCLLKIIKILTKRIIKKYCE